jgi:hypothetical protein
MCCQGPSAVIVTASPKRMAPASAVRLVCALKASATAVAAERIVGQSSPP